jgi:hypothetical protein
MSATADLQALEVEALFSLLLNCLWASAAPREVELTWPGPPLTLLTVARDVATRVRQELVVAVFLNQLSLQQLSEPWLLRQLPVGAFLEVSILVVVPLLALPWLLQQLPVGAFLEVSILMVVPLLALPCFLQLEWIAALAPVL